MTLETFMNDEPVQVAMKKCTLCEELKPATPEHFYRKADNKDGLQLGCKECANRFAKKAYQENGGCAKRHILSHKSPHRYAFITARTRVKNRTKYEWFLGEAGTPDAEAYIEYLKTITHCPDCAKEMAWLSHKKMDVNSASFDRINSDEHYTIANIRIVCRECNSRKNRSPVDEWVGLLEVRVKKGIIKEVDPALVKYLIEDKEEES